MLFTHSSLSGYHWDLLLCLMLVGTLFSLHISFSARSSAEFIPKEELLGYTFSR